MDDQQADEKTTAPTAPKSRRRRPLLWGLLSGWVLVFVPCLAVLVIQRHGIQFIFSDDAAWPYGLSMLLLIPVVQGFVAGLVRGKRDAENLPGWAIVASLWAVDTFLAAFFLREGTICLIMAAPLFLVVFAVTFVIGVGTADWRNGRRVSVSLTPLILIAAVLETRAPIPDHPDAVSDSIVIHAPTAIVWRYVVSYPENPAPSDYWLWNLGLPMPVDSVASAPEVGATRECRFTGGQSYGERIEVLEPGRHLVYRVTRQMTHPEIAGHVSFDEGDIRLVPNADGTTTMTMIGHYRLHVRPAPYFELWTRDIVRHIHWRVLAYTRDLAERDYAAAKSR